MAYWKKNKVFDEEFKPIGEKWTVRFVPLINRRCVKIRKFHGLVYKKPICMQVFVFFVFNEKTKAMKIMKTMICLVLLVAGLSGCEEELGDYFTRIDLNNLEGSWEKVYLEGVQNAGMVIWNFSAGNQDPHSWVLNIYVSDVFSGDSEAKYIYQKHQNGYPGIGSSTPELYLYEFDHDFTVEDRKVAYTPAARYYVSECTENKLVLKRIEVNVEGENLLEGEVAFRKMGLYTGK